jgi:hypothetical protein
VGASTINGEAKASKALSKQHDPTQVSGEMISGQ